MMNHKENMESLAQDIYTWCKKNDCWSDIIMYFNGKAWKSSQEWSGKESKKIAEDLYEFEDKNPSDYFEYANPETFSMSFEGPLYHILNGYTRGWTRLEKAFNEIFEKHGYYYEMGHAWNLSAYKN